MVVGLDVPPVATAPPVDVLPPVADEPPVRMGVGGCGCGGGLVEQAWQYQTTPPVAAIVMATGAALLQLASSRASVSRMKRVT